MASLILHNRLIFCSHKKLLNSISYSETKLHVKLLLKKVCRIECRFNSTLCDNEVNNTQQARFSPINIQMLSSGLHRQIFGENVNTNIDQKNLEKVVLHLQEHKLWGAETSLLPEVDFQIPLLCNSNIDDHFHHIGTQLSVDYKNLLGKLLNCELPPLPQIWKFQSGWVKYSSDDKTECVDFPEDPALVFDVEVCVQEGHYPTLATAVSENNWYLWCSEKLVQNSFSLSKAISISDLIPLETAQGQIKPQDDWKPRLVVGHNVAFDRTFVKEQYFLERTRLNFLDTMSLHICVSGLTGLQRSLSIAKKKDVSINGPIDQQSIPMGWSEISSLNNLADVFALYCDGEMHDKSEREVFVTGSLTEIRERFQELATYCAHDAIATHQILKNVTPMFFERFPHPVTFCGLLEMASTYLPVNQNWERYLNDAQSTYEDLQKELKLSLAHLANDACSLMHGNLYKNDPWLWDLDWSTQSLRFRKEKPPAKKKRKSRKEDKVNVVVKTVDSSIVPDFPEESALSAEKALAHKDPTLKDIFDTASNLRKVRPFLPGYPAWFRELCDKNFCGNENWEPGPILVSTQMRCAPKLMRLTWDGYPLHYDTKHGWGYLVPNVTDLNLLDAVNKDFPLRNFLNLFKTEETIASGTDFNVDFVWNKIREPREDKEEEAKIWRAILGRRNAMRKSGCEIDQHYGIGPHDIGINGVLFYCLPHKDGPHKRVGNPLSKDFLSKVEDGTLKTWGKEQADRALLLSKMLSYWKNSHSRIQSQMVVWLNKDELPNTIIQNELYDDINSYGAILPRLIPSGTVTRRAVEPTWLTASNAYEDRVGSELKSMIQVPPGYHFVGADVDSEELWIAAIFGDSQFAKLHGCTAFGWMTLQGKKSVGTDMHSKTATSVGISRHHAKILNYARIYGAGKAFAQRLLMQFNHRLTHQEAKVKVKKMFSETKGSRRAWAGANDFDDDEGLDFHHDSMKRVWVGGSESHMFNKLEEIALSPKPSTPVLNCRISRALEPKAVDKNFMTSRVNWVVQSSAVDFLHLMLVCMKWLFKEYNIQGRFVICIHDEVRYLVKSEDRYRAAMALQITNLLTRSFFTYKVGMYDLPQSVAFFSSVDVDLVIRKEVNMDSATPSNPHGLEKGHGIPQGESLDIFQILKKTNGGILKENS